MVHKRLLLLLAFACFLYWHRSGSRSTKQTHQSNTRLKPLCERIVLYIRFRPYARRLTGLHSALSHTHTRSCALSLTAHAALLLSSLHCHSHLSLSLSLSMARSSCPLVVVDINHSHQQQQHRILLPSFTPRYTTNRRESLINVHA